LFVEFYRRKNEFEPVTTASFNPWLPSSLRAVKKMFGAKLLLPSAVLAKMNAGKSDERELDWNG
jgi:hypothetical protein